MELRILGPVDLWVADTRWELGGPKERCAVAALVLAAGQTLSADALAERIWGEQPPAHARATLQSYISRLRRRLKDAGVDGTVLLTTSAHGYRLVVPGACVDVSRFDELMRHAETAALSDARRAEALLSKAIDLFRGEPLAGIPGDWAQAARASLLERRRAAVLKRIEVALRLGRHGQLIGELTELVARGPADQAAVGYLITALYRAGRQTEALNVYRRTRERLRALGLEPRRELRELHERVLRSDPSLTAQPAHGETRRTEPANALERDPAHFTGRAAELAGLLAAIEDDLAGGFTSVCVVDGMPGSGKSTLCLRAAHLLRDRFPGGALQLNLRGHDPYQQPMEPGEALLALLGLIDAENARLQRLDSLDACTKLWRSRTAEQPLLLLLDNARDAGQVLPLLPAARGSAVLITTRTRLPELADAHVRSLGPMPAADAGELFARLAGPERVDEPGRLREITALCGQLPLSVVVAAGHLRSRPAWRLTDLAQRLTYTRAQHDEDDHLSRPVRASFDASYQALNETERRLFRRVGLHPGAQIGLRAAAALGGMAIAEADLVLDALVNHNLVEEPARHRYRMHDLLRDFAVRRVHRDDDPAVRAESRRRMVSYYLTTAVRAALTLEPNDRRLTLPDESAPPDCPPVSTAAEAQDWFELEFTNLVACAKHALDRKSYRVAGQLAHSMAQFLDRRGRWNEAVEVHENALRAWLALGDSLGQAGALVDLAAANWGSGRLDQAQMCAETALGIYRDRGDRAGQADALLQLGRVHWRARRPQAADQCLRECATLRSTLGDRAGLGVATYHLGIVTLEFGVPGESLEHFETALRTARESGDLASERNCLNNLGEAYQRMGRYPEALRHYEAALELTVQIGSPHRLAIIAHNLGALHNHTADHVAALESFRDALATFHQLDDTRSEIETLIGMAEADRALGREPEAFELLRRSLRLLERVEDPLAHANVYQALGSAYEQRGERSEALTAYRSALAHSRRAAAPADQARAHRRIGDVLAVTRGRAAAREHWRKALSLFEELRLPDADEVRALLTDGQQP
ncbi:AfsR/SARP family transcriptional regulator [Actinocrinis puniceicyclus]|uniref:AfsR/SARP family transcriptional regulator n=1 Tax=Actinocrinis puniceicyclus TaxID=977794 RepID=UPI001B8CEBF2|nr:tetratricopeptide repeat protein [Actinocrinis puniceicyclus]